MLAVVVLLPFGLRLKSEQLQTSPVATKGCNMLSTPSKRNDKGNVYSADTYSNLYEQAVRTSMVEYSSKAAILGVPRTNSKYGNGPSNHGHVAVNRRGSVCDKEGQYTFNFTLTDNVSLI